MGFGDCTTTHNNGSNGNEVGMSEDLLIEILTRLPLKSLFRSNCVCKAWRGLISGDDHLRSRLPLVTSAVFCPRGGNPTYACVSRGSGFEHCALDFFPRLGRSSLIDSCNGLLLYYSTLPAPAAFYVVNPTTRRWVALPTPAKRSLLSVLAFDPSHSPHYRVVCFSRWRPRGAELEVFSSETRGWAEHVAHWGVETNAMTATMRYFDGVLHVLAHPDVVVAVDLATMAARRTELPEPVAAEGCISKCRGYLHYTTHRGGDRLRVWMLEDADRGQWVLKHCVSVREIDVPRQRFTVLALHPEREVVYFWVPGKLMSYDLGEERVEEVCEFGKEREEAFLVQICLFPFSRYVSDCLTNVQW